MPMIVWECPKQHKFESLETRAPGDSETRICPTCGEQAQQTFGVPAPARFAGRPWNA